jgi:hypothetical protein
MIISVLFVLFIARGYSQKYNIPDGLDEIDKTGDSPVSTILLSNEIQMDTISRPAENQEETVETVMEKVSAKLVEARELSLPQIKSVLLLDRSRGMNGLKSMIDRFHDSLIARLTDDLSFLLKEFNNSKGDHVLDDDDKYEFMQNLQDKWEQTVADEMQMFQEKVLPKWIYSVRSVWSGIENKVMVKIKKFKKFLKKMAPKSIGRCRGSISSFDVSENVEKSQALDIARFGRFELDVTIGQIFLFVSSVALIIVLCLTIPYLGALFAAGFIIDGIAWYLLR